MFGTKLDPAGAYSSVSVETAVTEASPHQLVVLLFEGAREAIIIARSRMEAGDIQQKNASITKAIDIILNGLRASLDLEKGEDLAHNLAALYEYMARRLLHANLNNDQAALDEVLALLTDIHSAWVEIGQTSQANPG
jgi:flagellar protein FliS